MTAFPDGQYGVILADPPWNYAVWSKRGAGRTAEAHYPTMTTGSIAALPVADLAAPDCALLMWATYPNLTAAMEVMEAWGFTYRTVAFTWVKLNPRGLGLATGLGYWTRANAEICLLGTRGHPKRKAKDVPQVIVSPRREHSRKPDAQYERIERLLDGPYIELFARHRREGWTVWGNQAPVLAGAA